MHHLKTAAGIGSIFALMSCGSADSQTQTPQATASQSSVTMVNVSTAKALLAQEKDAILIDVRTPDEFAAGHIEGAQNFDLRNPDFVNKIDKLDKNEHYIVYCRSGVRSAQATQIMDELGFSKITNVDGGITAWIEADYPVVS